MIRRAHLGLLAALTMLAGCSSMLGTGSPAPVEPRDSGKRAVPPAQSTQSTPKSTGYVLKKGGGYYLDDGPGDNPPPDLAAIADAVPVDEPLHRFANKPYNVFGRDYLPLGADTPYRSRGIASWYGRKFHGQKTSSGELYDMYGMTAAHPTLPIPSYVRVTNPGNSRSVVVRVNDRGPFHSDRIIDLSYTAAWKLGYIGEGSTLVEVDRILPGTTTISRPENIPPVMQTAVAPATNAANTVTTQRDASGTYLQLGAFGTRDNAESFLAHLARELSQEPVPGDETARLDSKLVIHSAGVWHRVQLGPWQNPDDAKLVRDRLTALVGSKPLVVAR